MSYFMSPVQPLHSSRQLLRVYLSDPMDTTSLSYEEIQSSSQLFLWLLDIEIIVLLPMPCIISYVPHDADMMTLFIFAIVTQLQSYFNTFYWVSTPEFPKFQDSYTCANAHVLFVGRMQLYWRLHYSRTDEAQSYFKKALDLLTTRYNGRTPGRGGDAARLKLPLSGRSVAHELEVCVSYVICPPKSGSSIRFNILK